MASFRKGADIPGNWDCPKCGWPAGKDRENTPPPPVIQPYKTHLAYVKERRSDEEAEDIPWDIWELKLDWTDGSRNESFTLYSYLPKTEKK